jgi:hypothetical protein
LETVRALGAEALHMLRETGLRDVARVDHGAVLGPGGDAVAVGDLPGQIAGGELRM